MSPNGLADDMAGATVAVAMLNFKDASIAPQAVLEQAKVDLKDAEPNEKTNDLHFGCSKDNPNDRGLEAVESADDAVVTERKCTMSGATLGSGEGDKKTGCIFPAEIMSKIIKYAMTAADGGRIMMPCLTNREFKPKLAVGLLGVNHAIYHEAILSLYMENQFVFDHFGSDIRALAKPTMISSCTANGCAWASNIPYIRAMRLELGSERDTYLGLLSIDAMENSLLNLRRPFFVEKLTLHFRIFPTHALDNLDSLILALQSIKVARILTITGPGKFQFVAAAIDIAGSLGLVPRPTWEFIKPSRGRDYAPTVKRRGFSYFRFKVDNATPDYDSYEGALIQKAVLKGAHIHGFNMWV